MEFPEVPAARKTVNKSGVHGSANGIRWQIDGLDPFAVLKIVQGAGVLTVGETPDFLGVGGMLSFFFQNDLLKFEVNLVAVNEAHLRASSKLLALARRVVNEPVHRRDDWTRKWIQTVSFRADSLRRFRDTRFVDSFLVAGTSGNSMAIQSAPADEKPTEIEVRSLQGATVYIERLRCCQIQRQKERRDDGQNTRPIPGIQH